MSSSVTVNLQWKGFQYLLLHSQICIIYIDIQERLFTGKYILIFAGTSIVQITIYCIGGWITPL